MRVGFIKYLIKRIAWVMVILIAWFSLSSLTTTLVEFYEMKIAVDQVTQDDFAYLMFRSVTSFKNVIHYLFSIITLVYLTLTGLNIYQEIKIEGEVKK